MPPRTSPCRLLLAAASTFALLYGASGQASFTSSPAGRPQTLTEMTSSSPLPAAGDLPLNLSSVTTSLLTTYPTSANALNRSSARIEPSQTNLTTTATLPLCVESTTVTWPPLVHVTTVRHDGWVIALIVLAGLGIICLVGIEVTILIRLYDTALLKDWRATWLGQVLIFALFCSFVTLFAFLPFPCVTTCGIIRFCVGVCYAMAFAVLFVKLMVILCGEHHAGFTAALFLFVWGVQVVIDIQWLIENRSVVVRISNSDGEICTPGFTEHVQSLIYVMVLIVACVLLAVLSHRHRRPGHIDGLFIGLASGLTVAIWIVWILLGFLESDSEWRDPCVAFGLLTTSYVLMLLMLLPKLYQLHMLRRTLFNHDVRSAGRPAYPSNYSTNQMSSYKQAEDRMSVTFYREAAANQALGGSSRAGSSRESLGGGGGGTSTRMGGAQTVGRAKRAGGDARSLAVVESSGYGSGDVGGYGSGGGRGVAARSLEGQLDTPSTHVSYSNDLDIDLEDVDYAAVNMDPRALHLQRPSAGGGSRSSRQGSMTVPTNNNPSVGSRERSPQTADSSAHGPQGYKPGPGSRANYVLSSWAEAAERERHEAGEGEWRGPQPPPGYVGSASYRSLSGRP